MGLETAGTRGVLNHYGARSTDESRGGKVATKTRMKQVVYKFGYDGLPSGAEDELTAKIPAGSILINAYIRATTNFVGGTSYDIGVEQPDGTAIDIDGLFDALLLAELNLGDVSDTHGGTNSGAILDLELTAEACVIAVATGTFTAGEAELVVEYV
jgi:hypothetical protein